MAKELPYFKFEPSEWENGNIQMCSKESKGLFIDLCSLYWSRLGEVPYALALQKHCNGNALALQELENNQIISVENNQIIIDFLDEQLDEFQKTSDKRRDAANKRWSDANAMQMQCKSNAIREEKRREEKIKEEKSKEEELKIYPSFDDFWNCYDNKVNAVKCKNKWSKTKQADKEKIMLHVPLYVQATPDKKFRKHPLTYLNNQGWNDEIIQNNGNTKNNHGLSPEQQAYILSRKDI